MYFYESTRSRKADLNDFLSALRKRQFIHGDRIFKSSDPPNDYSILIFIMFGFKDDRIHSPSSSIPVVFSFYPRKMSYLKFDLCPCLQGGTDHTDLDFSSQFLVNLNIYSDRKNARKKAYAICLSPP